MYLKPKNLISIVLCLIFVSSCGDGSYEVTKPKRLDQTVKQEIEIKGSLMIVSNGIMVLAGEENQRVKSTILIAFNDSLKEIAQCSYDERIDNGCFIGLNPWISFKGHYLRDDSTRSVFLYRNLTILDSCTTCSMILEE